MTTNADLLTRRNAAVVRGIGHTTPLSASRARNAELWDVEGKRYIDFAGGIAVVNTGHCHPRIIAAVQEQMERFTHTCFQVVMYEPYITLAERLNALVPISGAVKSAFFTTGAEATENAIKIARAATGRSGVIAFTGGFHGRTILASALTGKVVPYKKGLGPALPEVWHVPFPTGQNDVTVEDALKYLGFIFKADVDPSRVAAIIIEPVQGEGGFHQAPQELLRALRRICDEHGIVLIADEVQTGFGRTGTMFAMEHYEVEPDLICVAKSLAGGFPLSGVIGRAPIMDAAETGGLGGTYAGNPLACVAALAVLDVFENEKLLERSQAIGARLKARLGALQTRNDLLPVRAIRGPGATGSTGVGRWLMKEAADGIKRLSLELGGNAPFIVFDDADLDAAVDGAMASKFRNAGQTCVCANRIYVQESVAAAFAEKLAAKAKALKLGRGTEEGVSMGPLIDDRAVAKMEEHVADALAKGGQVLVGGRRSSLGGTFFEPTVMTGITQGMKVTKEETFAPLAPIVAFADEAEVIAMANDSEFGLAAYFYARDMARVWRVAEALESGMVGVNTPALANEMAPFGGVKQSGLGREGSKYGIEGFLEIKYINLAGL